MTRGDPGTGRASQTPTGLRCCCRSRSARRCRPGGPTTAAGSGRRGDRRNPSACRSSRPSFSTAGSHSCVSWYEIGCGLEPSAWRGPSCRRCRARARNGGIRRGASTRTGSCRPAGSAARNRRTGRRSAAAGRSRRPAFRRGDNAAPDAPRGPGRGLRVAIGEQDPLAVPGHFRMLVAAQGQRAGGKLAALHRLAGRLQHEHPAARPGALPFVLGQLVAEHGRAPA